jgi:SAM-dependent methyltransferase
MDFKPFIGYCNQHIKGDEKGEAQIFLEHFFVALGFVDGLKGAGADCEYRIKNDKKKTSFADLVWKPRVLIEMKKSGEDLSIHLQQAFSYWSQLVPNRPNYVILCNFDEFWIYDFDKDIYEPQEKIDRQQLEQRKEAFTFLLPKAKKPLFQTDREDVTEKVAGYIADLYRSLAENAARNPVVPAEDAMLYCLQCVLCLFAEDIDLLPGKIFTRLIDECVNKEGTGHDKIPETFDLISGLFREMNTSGVTPGGRYKDVDYFNGGLFDKIIPIELSKKELDLLEIACRKNWWHINPSIFGSIFEGLMNKERRHTLGAHYTSEIDIKKIIDPVIVQPWRQKIDDVLDKHDARQRDKTTEALKQLHIELCNYKVLDPACGSGNFLFVAYKEIKLIEKEILGHFKLIADNKTSWDYAISCNHVSTNQFFGMDLNPNAVELAKVTLMIAKEMSIKEAMDKQETLPLDNLDRNIISTDALFTEWPQVDAIIGNPPFQSKNKMQQEFGVEYTNKLRKAYPEVPGRADFCVYWFYKAHKHMKNGSYAGLVGTNTIRQNYSREGSLDFITNNGGEIFNAYSSVEWGGEAVVFVSIVSWKKGDYIGEKELYTINENKETQRDILPYINSSLSLNIDVSSAKVLACNKEPKKCFQGQTHGHPGFLLSVKEAKKILNSDIKYEEVIKPFLIGDELVGKPKSIPERFVIDFSYHDVLSASSFSIPFKILEEKILPYRKKVAEEQEKKNREALEKNPKIKVTKHRINFLKQWWRLDWFKREMLDELKGISRYIACSRVTSRPIFEFIATTIRPSDALMVFAFEDDYSFGIIQSNMHWNWFIEKCSTMKGDPRYTTDSVWDTFPWPQTPTEAQIKKVAKAAKALRLARTQTMLQHKMSFRDLYRLLEQPGNNPIKDLHAVLDNAVIAAYNFDHKKDLLSQLLTLNFSIAQKETKNEKIQAPGLPEFVKNKNEYVSDDCVRFEWN